MKILSKLTLCVFAMLVFNQGCADKTTEAPPVLSILDDLDALEKEREEQKMQKLREEAAAKTGAFDPSVSTVPADVPLTGKYTVQFDTSVGMFVVDVDRSWAPIGADRFYQLVKNGFYDDARFFRVIPGFMVQWGLAADPAMSAKWSQQITDDPVIKSNTRGYITFAKTGAPNSRTGQVFINYADNSSLDGQGFAPFGKVTSGMDVVTKINSEYGESPNQGQITSRGNEYLMAEFPRLSFIKQAKVIKDDLKSSEDAASTPATSETE